MTTGFVMSSKRSKINIKVGSYKVLYLTNQKEATTVSIFDTIVESTIFVRNENYRINHITQEKIDYIYLVL